MQDQRARGAEDRAGRWVLALREAGRDRAADVGGKAGPLGELLRAGFPVPDGFCVSATAYRQAVAGAVEEVIAAALAALDPAGPASLEAASEQIGAAFAAAPLPDGLAQAVAGAYAALAPQDGPVAVRSSATAEDLPEASFAGQQRTFLNVRGAGAVLEAVRQCWAGLWTAEAMAYRRQVGVPPQEAVLAVLVQRMVEAEQAGVLFTADPVAEDRGTMVVEAVAGLGEALVQGEAQPERVALDRRTLAVRERSGPAAGTALSERTLRDLGTLGIGVEAALGAPQDIEWALAGGRVWVVQARPITTLGRAAPERLPRPMAEMLLERYPEPPLPLDLDLIVRPVLGTTGIAPGGRWLDPPLEASDGVVTGLAAPGRLLRQTPWRLALLAASRAPGVGPEAWERRDRPLAEAAVRALAATGLAPLSDSEVVDFLERTRTALAGAFRARWRAVINVAPDLLLLHGLVRLAVGPGERAAAVDDLLAGVEHVTSAMNRELAALAAAVRAVPEAARLLAGQPPDEAAARLAGADDPALAALWRRMEEVRGRYAAREVGGMSLVNPSWGEDPAYLAAAVASLAQVDAGEDRAVASAARAAAARRRVLAGLERRCLGGLRGTFERRLERVRAGYRLREDSHFVLLGFLPSLRRGALELGRRWTGRGWLDRPEDVLFLTLDDLRAVAASEREARPAMEQRRRRWRTARRGWSSLLPPAARDAAAPPGALAGTAASRGFVTAPARLIRDQREFHRLRPGEVLVCPAASPSWTPLFALAAAVVTETGGMMSHAAIVAREYGIPAVMGVGGALSELRDGELVMVDGGRGWVLPQREGATPAPRGEREF